MDADLPSSTGDGRPRPRPLLIYDGKCGTCKRAIERWRFRIGDRIDYVPFQEAHALFPDLDPAIFRKKVHFVSESGELSSGARAVFEALDRAPEPGFASTLYHGLPGFRPVAEAAYGIVASIRPLLSWHARWFVGRVPSPVTHAVARNLFTRLLGAVFLVAFSSIWWQMDGLFGSRGILPAQAQVAAIRASAKSDARAMLDHPTLLVLDSSDKALFTDAGAGILLSVALVIGLWPKAILFLLWALYLSLVTVGRPFMNFQWDALLLETAFLSLFFVPFRPLWSQAGRVPPRRLALFILWFLLFKLMFLSGAVKLVFENLPGVTERPWHALTALEYHYFTQPLPTWLGYHAHHLPAWAQKASCAAMFGIECGLPFLIFLFRRLRLVAFLGFVLFQILIMATGNYGFFNALTIVLCVPLLDDHTLLRILPRGLREKLAPLPAWRRPRSLLRQSVDGLRFVVLFAAAVTTTILSGSLIRDQVRPPPPGAEKPAWMTTVFERIEPFESLNGYGLFRNMTRERPEIIVQGSDDGKAWLDYEFFWKPGALDRPPPFVEPHMPRLDWQMWFAALSSYRANAWFQYFAVNLLLGNSAVTRLLRTVPFKDKPPKYLRAVRYRYQFTTEAERRATGRYWKRDQASLYAPVLTIRGNKLVEVARESPIAEDPAPK